MNVVYQSELVNSHTADLIAAAKAHRLAKRARRANRLETHIVGHSDPSVPSRGDTTVL
jgi:hypothetical protein